MSDAATDAHALLRALGERARRHASPLPRVQAPVAAWRGLGFSIGGVPFVSVLGEAVEVLTWPRLTPVPGAGPWLLGIANVRGRLLPVTDAHRFFGLTTGRPRHLWRVLVVAQREHLFGLAVEQSHGIQQFAPECRVRRGADLGRIERFVDGAFAESGRIWHLLSLAEVARDARFLDAARRSAA
jgi:twitching motility protein PilI